MEITQSNGGAPRNSYGTERIFDVLSNAEHQTVRASCKLCGHLADVDWLAVSVGYSSERALKTLARRLRCKACGARACVWHVTANQREP